MRLHSKLNGLAWDVVRWPGLRHRVYIDEMLELGMEIEVGNIDPAKYSARALYLERVNLRDEGGRYIVVREPDACISVMRDHDTGDVEGYGKEL